MRDSAAIEHTQNIRAGLPIIKMKYGLTIDEYDYLDMAIDALRDIKHYGIQPYVTFETVDKDGYVKIPCNANIIEGVATSDHGIRAYQDRDTIKNKQSTNGSYYTANSIRSILSWPIRSINTIDGQLSYKLEDDRIKVYDEFYQGLEICVAFTGYMVDDDGYPKITRKQANALAAIIAKNIIMKGALLGDKNKVQMLEMIGKDAARLKQAASLPENISDKELDEMMDATTTFNRKAYKRPNKWSR